VRYLAFVGIAMTVGGIGALIIGILRIAQFMASIGATSFECSGSGCDVLGDAPLLIFGGIVLLVVGIIVASLGGTAAAVGSATDPGRWQALSRIGRIAPNRLSSGRPAWGNQLATHDFTAWNSMAGRQAMAATVAPMVATLLQRLSASGLLEGLPAQIQMIDAATGRPMLDTAAPDGRTDAERERDLRATGTLGNATVQRFSELPAAHGDARLYELYLSVTAEGHPPYQLRHFDLVPTRWAYRVANGATLPVWVDPGDPSRLLVDWERS
jgi:hypothetical protein